jgi:PPM family protein phosphatase
MSNSNVQHAIPLDVGVCSRAGRRDHNEDNYAISTRDTRQALPDSEIFLRKGYLYVVADGMGGHEAGDVASAIAVETVYQAYYHSASDLPADALCEAIAAANQAILTETRRHSGSGGRPMGTTIVCAVIHNQHLTIAHVGDSRAYHISAQEPFHTRDHDWISSQAHLRDLPEKEARNYARAAGMAGKLMRALGVSNRVQPDISERNWSQGDVLLLCSDGLHVVLDIQDIVQMSRERPAAQVAQTLVDRAYALGSGDNITALLVQQPAPAVMMRIGTRTKAQSLAHNAPRIETTRRPGPATASTGRSILFILVPVVITLILLIGMIAFGGLLRPEHPSATESTPTPPFTTTATILANPTATPRSLETTVLASTPLGTAAPFEDPATPTPIPPTPTFTALPTAIPTPTSPLSVTVEPTIPAPVDEGLSTEVPPSAIPTSISTAISTAPVTTPDAGSGTSEAELTPTGAITPSVTATTNPQVDFKTATPTGIP